MSNKLKGRSFLSIKDFSKEEIEVFMQTATRLKQERNMGIKHHILEDKAIFLIFYNRSLRTRNSFETGIMHLGGHANYLSSDKVYTPKMEGEEEAFVTERVSDVARVLSRYGEGIAIRIFGKYTNWEYGKGDQYLREFASWSKIPVINLENDKYHPCQGLADLLTMKEKKGDLKEKKIVISWAYSPSSKKPMAVPHSMALGSSLFGANIVIAQPKEFNLDPDVMSKVEENIEKFGGSLEVTHDMVEAFTDADVVYPKSYPVLNYLKPYNEKSDFAKMNKVFEKYRNWKTTQDIMARAKDDCIYMHCLPADRGFEVSDEVMDGSNSVVFDQAENRLHAQKAIMALTM